MFKSLWRTLREECSGVAAYQTVADISRYHRIQASPDFRQAAEYVPPRATWPRRALRPTCWTTRRTRIRPFGGRQLSGVDAHSGTMHLIEPRDQARKLADYREVPVSLNSRWMPPSKLGGILATLVKIACGGDSNPIREYTLLEIEHLVRAGMTEMEALIAVTRTCADLCRVVDWLGTVEVGKLADLIVLSANPLEDISNIRNLKLVFKGGNLVDTSVPEGLGDFWELFFDQRQSLIVCLVNVPIACLRM